LLFVLGGAVFVTFVTFRFVLRMAKPWAAARFELSNIRVVDFRLVAGAAVFGVGWGLAGYCPGPAVAGLGAGSAEALWFLAAMLLGFIDCRRLVIDQPKTVDDGLSTSRHLETIYET
jgi:uncharacterized membrane protein YedE/YeeE